ncbi:hypothetical protein CERZMDRAFT_53344, partial [Cercospora zeae-maydis SCOH1-5]
YNPIRYRPIAVSIETKVAHAGTAEATLQLTTWVKAQIRHLRDMSHRSGRIVNCIIPLPLILVAGHEWTFYYLQDTGTEAILWGGILLGKIDTICGIYQVLAAMQRLVHWAHITYRAWHQENIMQPLLTALGGVRGG